MYFSVQICNIKITRVIKKRDGSCTEMTMSQNTQQLAVYNTPGIPSGAKLENCRQKSEDALESITNETLDIVKKLFFCKLNWIHRGHILNMFLLNKISCVWLVLWYDNQCCKCNISKNINNTTLISFFDYSICRTLLLYKVVN